MAHKISNHVLSPDARAEIARRRREPLEIALASSSQEDQEAGTRQLFADCMVALLMDRGDGWLRVTADADSGVMYVFFKFKSGRWAGRYVVARVRIDEFSDGLVLLNDKLALVDRGQLTPSKDRDDRYAPRS